MLVCWFSICLSVGLLVNVWVNFHKIFGSIVVLEENPCPQGSSRTSLQDLVLGPEFLVLDHKVVARNLLRTPLLQTVR